MTRDTSVLDEQIAADNAASATWRQLLPQDQDRLRVYVGQAITGRGRTKRAREITAVLRDGLDSAKRWLDFLSSPGGLNTVETGVLPPMMTGGGV
jgi:hypothetical protein